MNHLTIELSCLDRIWYVTVKEIEGCHSYGATIEEALKNITEAICASGNYGEY